MTILGHPAGLFLLFLVEMWERFSYYGMRGLLVLYLVQSATPAPDASGLINPGRGWSRADASMLYGWYTGLAYLLPIAGGVVADRFLGTHRSMVAGALLIALGHLVLAVSGLGELARSTLGMTVFILGLALVVIGTGHFKPCVSVMVGQLYPHGDGRRDGAFTIFYMGINLGAFLSAFVCGTLGERVGWHWGFGSAAVGMLAGLALYTSLRPRFLADVGLPPPGARNLLPVTLAGGATAAVAFAALYHTGAIVALADGVERLDTMFGRPWLLPALLTAAIVAAAAWFVRDLPPADRGPTVTIFVFMLFNAVFWWAFEQAGSSLNLFTDMHTERTLGRFTVPTTWFQSVNAGLILLLSPLFAVLWSRLARRGRDPHQPVKIALGLAFLALGYVFMVWAGVIAADGVTKAPMMLVIATYFWHTVGELCLSPTGLSYVTKAAPLRWASLLMGIWFVSSFIANLAGGMVAAQVEAIERGTIALPWRLGGQADFFLLFVVAAGAAAVLMLVLSPLLDRLAGDRA
jgi:POT family proton-dependent oligopeptide transporter